MARKPADEVVYTELIEANRSLIEEVAKVKDELVKKWDEVLFEIKNIKESIYLQERYHRGH